MVMIIMLILQTELVFLVVPAHHVRTMVSASEMDYPTSSSVTVLLIGSESFVKQVGQMCNLYIKGSSAPPNASRGCNKFQTVPHC